jgi:tyrosine-protein kinase Etk/Wzc
MSEEVLKSGSGNWLKEILARYFKYWPIIPAIVTVVLALTYLKLRYTPRVYKAEGTIVFISDKNQQEDKLNKLLLGTAENNVANEIEVLKSRLPFLEVVKQLRLQTRLYQKGNVMRTEIYPNNVAYIEKLSQKSALPNLIEPYQIQFKNTIAIGPNSFKLSTGKQVFLNKPFAIGSDTFVFKAFDSTGLIPSEFVGLNYDFLYLNNEAASQTLSKGLKANSISKFVPDVVKLNYESNNPYLSSMVLNALMNEYIALNVRTRRNAEESKLSFIESFNSTLEHALDSIEKKLTEIKRDKKFFERDIQLTNILSRTSDVDKNITEARLVLFDLNFLVNKLSSAKDGDLQVPTSLSIKDPVLLQNINEYNKWAFAYKNIVSENNPADIVSKNEFNKAKRNLLENLKNIKSAQEQKVSALEGVTKNLDGELSKLPQDEQFYTELLRQQKLNEQLYILVKEKKIETSLAVAGQTPNAQIIETALLDTTHISPKKITYYFVGLVLAFILAFAIIYLLGLFNNRVQSRYDVENRIKVPIYGELSHVKTNKGESLVNQNKRGLVFEQLRMFRSNIGITLRGVEKPVVLFSSAVSGEGKSFSAATFAMVNALNNKKVILLELDLRRPGIRTKFNLPTEKGFVNYLIDGGKIIDYTIPIPEIKNLHVLLSGLIPPNPSELLSDKKTQKMFEELKQSFDLIVIDTAPIGLVTDGLILSSYADLAIYLVRHNYSTVESLKICNDFFEKTGIKGGVLLNDVKLNTRYGGYAYNSLYGGSGNNHEYYIKDNKNDGFFKRIKSFFTKK